MDEPTLMKYPLGESLFAYVKTRKGGVKIHLRHFATPINTKGGRLVSTQKGVTMDLKALQRLVRVQKNLKADYQQQVERLSRSPKETCPKPTYSSAESGSFLQQAPEAAPNYFNPFAPPSIDTC